VRISVHFRINSHDVDIPNSGKAKLYYRMQSSLAGVMPNIGLI
jgi:hypothetical protein